MLVTNPGRAVLLALPFAFGSVAGGQQPSLPHEVLANGALGHTLAAAPVSNLPFSAVFYHEVTRTLADGSHISSHGQHAVARDSQGRVHVEVKFGSERDGTLRTLIFVKDPVAHTLTTWTVGSGSKPLASVTKLPEKPVQPPSPASHAPSPEITNRPKPVVTQQNLGTVVWNGLSVREEKITTVVPVGRAGNDAPITKQEEIWTSPDLKLIVKQQWTDPRTGVRTQELRNLTQAEPPASLFHPPAGYTMKTTAEAMHELAEKLNSLADEQSQP